MPALFKRNGGSIWHVDYVYQGRRVRKSTGTSDRKLAELFLKDIEVKIERDNLGFNDLNAKKIRLSEFSEEYLQHSKVEKAYNTYLIDRHALRLLNDFLGKIHLIRISVKHLEDFKVSRLAKVKPTSVNIELKHLKAAFETAFRWSYIYKNPFKAVKLCKIKNANHPKFFTRDEVNELLDAIPDGVFKNLVYFYLYTGSRRNEALNLEWKDIDLDNGKVTLRETKSGENRIVPFNGILIGVIKSMERNSEKPFPFKEDFVTHKFKKYLRATGIKDKEVLNVHSLRHTYASHLVMKGTDLYTVSKLLGHSSVKVTEMYAHLVPDYLKTAVERLRY